MVKIDENFEVFCFHLEIRPKIMLNSALQRTIITHTHTERESCHTFVVS